MSKITIYKTPSCAYCAQTTRYLDSKGITYEVLDVTAADYPEYRELTKTYGYTVPLVTDGKTAYCGWQLNKLNEMIKGQ